MFIKKIINNLIYYLNEDLFQLILRSNTSKDLNNLLFLLKKHKRSFNKIPIKNSVS